jgi:hypothetical protein
MIEENQKVFSGSYEDALDALKQGLKVKLPEWTGHWFMDEGVIKVLTKNGDILSTPHLDFHKSRMDWQITDGSLGFDFAILAIKNGKAVRRKGWNGKGMFVFMRPADALSTNFIVNTVKSLPNVVKDFYKPFQTGGQPDKFGAEDVPNMVTFTPYLCMKAADDTIVNGWLASQTDMLATDWELAF